MLIGYRPRARRRGVILIVVLALLTLFALLGIAFVLVAKSQETSARIARESETKQYPHVEPEAAFAFALGQLLYDIPDDAEGIRSGLRGHSLARSIYGWNDTDGAINDVPFNGTGRLNYPIAALADPTMPNWNNNAWLVNYTHFPADGVLRHPEKYDDGTAHVYTGGQNLGYTYPDHQNFFLAEINPSTGEIVVPSFHREYLFGRLDHRPPTNASSPLANENVNWVNKIGKYLTVRPRPGDHSGFPYPVDRFGDVKNLDGAPGGCDSIWIDVNAPVMTASDGRRYKMLVAPLILALDGRINLNVAGNLMGHYQTANQTHRSNQGWGPWEVNPQPVLDHDATEWRRILLGSDEQPTGGRVWARIRGRYDNNAGARGPAPVGTPLSNNIRTRLWAQVDFNGMRETGNAGDQSKPIQLPGAGSSAWHPFPTFPSDTYGNGVGEMADHPLRFNVLQRPAAPNRHLPVSDLAALLRHGGTGGDALPSDLMRLLPKNLASMKRRNQVTLLSMDLDRPAMVPYVWDPNDPDPARRFRLRGDGLPDGIQRIPFPSLAARGTSLPANSSFNAEWRTRAKLTERLDLSRHLTPYPVPNSTGQFETADAATLARGVGDRQAFARQIFDKLRIAVGADDPPAVYANYGPNSDEYRALRWLAQVAVNVVDYVDNDDYVTPFNWFSYSANGSTTAEYVFGTEMPRLVINESYVQYDNSAADAAGGKVPAGGNYHVNVWIELVNPVPKDLGYNGGEDCQARLTVGDAAAYRILLADEIAPAEMRRHENTLGDPGAARTKSTHSVWGKAATQVVLPFDESNRFSCPAGGNVGFYVVGPPQTAYAAASNPNLPTTLTSPSMTYAIPALNAPAVADVRPTIVLQRLANPAMPLQNNPSDPLTYNPYVTIDFEQREAEQVNEGRVVDLGGAVNVATPINQRLSYGRWQPDVVRTYIDRPGGNDLRAQPAAANNQPRNTFYRQNSTAPDAVSLANAGSDPTLGIPFTWRVHLDRQLISPVELLHVSLVKPSELTHSSTDPHGDRARILYRFLEMVSVTPRGAGLVRGGRVPGKINLNAIWTREVFRALCDPQTGNSFNADEVDSRADRFILQRSRRSNRPGVVVIGPTDRDLSALSGQMIDMPFWPLSMGRSTGPDALARRLSGRGIEDTLLRSGGPDELFMVYTGVVFATHPYQRWELFTKIFNHATTRSNVFAIWMTVGFFEVDVSGKLGVEIGKAENRHVRHRAFAIVDRTQMQLWPTYANNNRTTPSMRSSTPITVPPDQDSIVVKLALPAQVVNAETGYRWVPQDGASLIYEPDTPNEETVFLEQSRPNGFQALFRRSHPANATIIVRGNPGPWRKYDPKKDSDVVVYYALID